MAEAAVNDTASHSRHLTRAASSQAWVSGFADLLLLTDVVVVFVAVFGSQFARWGLDGGRSIGWGREDFTGVAPWLVSLAVVVLWLIALSAFGTRSARVLGSGPTEYMRVFEASFTLFGLVAIFSYLTTFELARGFVAMAFPAGLLLLLLERALWRRWLTRQRAMGRYSRRVLLVGSPESAEHVVRQLRRAPSAGFNVLGVCVPGGRKTAASIAGNVSVFGDIPDVIETMDKLGADTVVLTSSDSLPADEVKRISWSLEPGRRHLVVAPALTDIGGPRIHTRPVAGLPLLHVETPKFEGAARFFKRFVDLIGSTIGIALLAVPGIVVAIIIKLDSRGPVFFLQERIGYHGKTFRMVKFRSMRTDAEDVLKSLLDQQGEEAGNEVLFKMKNDPRITKIGTFIRRYSIDELPQLINVFKGEMSIIGPRPPLKREVDQYESHVMRRFLVKPGITGLWQVSGRSNLSWEESVRLDLYYVENWSAMGDLQILWRTARAVFARDGAY